MGANPLPGGTIPTATVGEGEVSGGGVVFPAPVENQVGLPMGMGMGMVQFRGMERRPILGGAWSFAMAPGTPPNSPSPNPWSLSRP